jgi:glycerophosphoryl diester phosphodiesterase
MTRQSAAKLPEGSHHSQGKADAHAASKPVSVAAKFRPLLLGHRGARPLPRFKLNPGVVKVPPENTIACFEYALAHGCDGFEFDVRITRDERLVICHNAWLRSYQISTSSFDILCSRCGVTLPCLEDVLAAFASRAYLDVEVKVPGSEEMIAKALRCCRPRRYLVSSFLPQVLRSRCYFPITSW